MKTLLLNNCSHYHAGSALVTRELRRKMQAVGMVEINCAEEAELILINGEGTMHRDAPRALELLSTCKLRHEGQKVALVNSLWQNMTPPPPGLSVAVARESRSELLMRKDAIAREIHRLPDITLCCKHRPDYVGGKGLIVIDSVWDEETRWLEQIAAEFHGRMIHLCADKREPEAIIDELATADLVLSGRFHGLMFAALAGAPFLAARSNSHKTPGFLADYDMSGALVTSAEEARAKLHRGGYRFSRRLLPQIDAEWKVMFESIRDCSAVPLAVSVPESAPPVETKTAAVPRSKTAAACPVHIWSRPKTVVLVGNGPGLIGKGLGRVIDAHDEVVRFNEFEVRNHEHDVGERTTLWSTCAASTRPAAGELPARVLCVHERTRLPHEPRELLRVPAAFYDQMAREIRAISKHAHAPEVRPSSGFLVCRWLLESGCPRLHLAGFDHFRKHESRQHHYWQAKPYGRPCEHDGDAEAELLSPYVAERRVIYLT